MAEEAQLTPEQRRRNVLLVEDAEELLQGAERQLLSAAVVLGQTMTTVREAREKIRRAFGKPALGPRPSIIGAPVQDELPEEERDGRDGAGEGAAGEADREG